MKLYKCFISPSVQYCYTRFTDPQDKIQGLFEATRSGDLQTVTELLQGQNLSPDTLNKVTYTLHSDSSVNENILIP